jgi:hypothetical protein
MGTPKTKSHFLYGEDQNGRATSPPHRDRHGSSDPVPLGGQHRRARRQRRHDPPSAPRIVYVQGYYCLTIIVGVDRSTDNRTP